MPIRSRERPPVAFLHRRGYVIVADIQEDAAVTVAAEISEQQGLAHARQPIGRMGRPDEIAAAALYLTSDEAAFITGSTLTANGGQYLA